jgi:hypothetical protein
MILNLKSSPRKEIKRERDCKPSATQQSTTPQEAYEIGVETYIYFYPVILMDLTRKQLTNIEAGKMFWRWMAGGTRQR